MVFEGVVVLDLYTWVVIPVLIFFARIVDVSLGTMRVIFIAKGLRFVAPLLGFFEVIVWLLAVQQILVHVSNVACYIAYGAGFAAGTFIGMVIEEKLSFGKVIVRIVTQKDASRLVKALDKEGFIETVSKAAGPQGNVKVVYVVIDRYDARDVVTMIQKYHPKAFYSIEDIRYVSGPLPSKHYGNRYQNMFGFYRKAK